MLFNLPLGAIPGLPNARRRTPGAGPPRFQRKLQQDPACVSAVQPAAVRIESQAVDVRAMGLCKKWGCWGFRWDFGVSTVGFTLDTFRRYLRQHSLFLGETSEGVIFWSKTPL